MPVYEYKAINPDGKKDKGTIDADSMRAARQRLRNKGVFPTDIKEVTITPKGKSQDITKYFASNRVTPKELTIATRQLATLVGAGLPLVSSLNALAEQSESPVLKRIVIDVRENVEEGSSLSIALAKFPKSFPNLYINMVNAGEASGTLDIVLTNLADHFEAQMILKSKVRSALIYPVLMLIICTLVIIGLFVFVIPNIVKIFTKQGAVLPLPTRIMILISDCFINYWYLLIILIVVSIVSFFHYYRQEQGRLKIDRMLLKIPIFGPLYLKTVTARVALTMGALLGSGVQLLQALDIVKKIIGNVHVSKALEQAKEGVREGRSLAKELGKTDIFPVMVCHMIAVGEKSGALEEMLNKAGSAYENEVSTSVEGLTSLLEPVLMIVVGGIVLCIVISVLLPMADMIDILQS